MAKFEVSGIDEAIESIHDLLKVDVDCPTCGRKLKVDLKKHPKSIVCPKCKTTINLTYNS